MCTNADVRVGQRRCSPAPRKGNGVVHVDVDSSRGFQQARVAHVEQNRSGCNLCWLRNRRPFTRAAHRRATTECPKQLKGIKMSSSTLATPIGSTGFDVNAHFRSVMNELGLSPEDTGGAITFVGEDPIFPSVHRLGARIG